MTHRRLHIAYVFPRLEWCGPLKGILATISHLPPTDYRVTLITLAPPKHPEIREVCAQHGCTYIQLQQRRFLDLRLAREIATLIQSEDIDILHTTVLRPDWHGALAKLYYSRFTLVSTLRAEDDKLIRLNRGLLKYLVTHPLNIFFFRFFDHVIALSNSTRGYAERLHLPPDKVSLIRNAVDVQPLIGLDREHCRRTVAESLHLPSLHHLVGMLATFWPYKDHRSFLELAAAMQHDPSVFFVDAGDGPQLPHFQHLARKRGLSNLLYPGFVSSAPTLQAALDVHVFLSHTEGLPRAVMESMAAGTPVLAWDSPGVGECIRHMETGILVPKGDMSRLQQCLKELLRDPDLRGRLAKAAREAVLRDYSASRMADEHAQLYQRLLGVSHRE